MGMKGTGCLGWDGMGVGWGAGAGAEWGEIGGAACVQSGRLEANELQMGVARVKDEMGRNETR